MYQLKQRSIGNLGRVNLQHLVKWRSTSLLTAATVVGVIVVASIQKASISSGLAFVISMMALIPSGSLLRHCIRHLINCIQLRVHDQYRAHMMAGALDCLLGYTIFPTVSLSDANKSGQHRARAHFLDRGFSVWGGHGVPNHGYWLYFVKQLTGIRRLSPYGCVGERS